MPRTHRFNSTEQKIVDLADKVIADPSASPAELTAAMRTLERVLAKAERRARERDEDADWNPTAPPAPEPPSVDDLVRQLENGSTVPVPSVPSPLQPVQTVQDSQTGQNVQDGQNDPKLAEVLAIADGKKPQPVMESVEPKCKICRQPAPDQNMTWPIGDPKGRRVCPDCFQTMCAMCARSAPPPPPPELDWETNFATQRNVYSPDFQKSVEIWREQDIENAERQEQERKERASAEAEFNRRQADLISGNIGWRDGGRL